MASETFEEHLHRVGVYTRKSTPYTPIDKIGRKQVGSNRKGASRFTDGRVDNPSINPRTYGETDARLRRHASTLRDLPPVRAVSSCAATAADVPFEAWEIVFPGSRPLTPSELDIWTCSLGDDRDVVLELAKALDWPMIPLGPGLNIGGFESGWVKWVKQALYSSLAEARSYLESLITAGRV